MDQSIKVIQPFSSLGVCNCGAYGGGAHTRSARCSGPQPPEKDAPEKFAFEAEYRPGQTVTILALERPGHVTLVRVDEGGRVDYHVVWWDEGKRCSEWLDPREIGAADG